MPGATVEQQGFDGRSDVVVLEVGRQAQAGVLNLALAEDLFVEVGRTQRSEGDNPRWIADRIWKAKCEERALSFWVNHVRPLSGSMTFRIIARVLQERSFLRTDLRREMTRVIGRARPRWKVDDPAQIEIWIVEYQQGRFVAGLRLSTAQMRQHQGRATERPGALRPTVAAAMVDLAGVARGALLDPCCGSGTILAEARAAGWQAHGSDIDPEAVEIARANVPSARVQVADARKLDVESDSVGACVSNLPFGQQFEVEGDMTVWLADVLAETARVTWPGSRVVLLAPEIPRSSVPQALRPVERHLVRLLGTKTSIWVYEKASASVARGARSSDASSAEAR